ncbi:hypothetical protein PR202_gb27659 [Eleusine coracana subsp. coracana]|uniref:Berberine/berberine-like domain-containing protein n=1 Tax=Eleusine coracana subsp. coracana TaxID=191504 RepID=A0AAV5FV12_ELECO|nr:hypothetical protein PR202_gb27659 [Eleusine coracana subsp. coracana]
MMATPARATMVLILCLLCCYAPVLSSAAAADFLKCLSAYESARVWGERYFGAANFKRLAITKGKTDPSDFFRNEQSIPPLVPRK